jgi:hypothetical protein
MFSDNAQGGDYMSKCHHLTYNWLIPKECTYNISYERMQSRHFISSHWFSFLCNVL